MGDSSSLSEWWANVERGRLPRFEDGFALVGLEEREKPFIAIFGAEEADLEFE